MLVERGEREKKRMEGEEEGRSEEEWRKGKEGRGGVGGLIRAVCYCNTSSSSSSKSEGAGEMREMGGKRGGEIKREREMQAGVIKRKEDAAGRQR